MTWPRLVDLFSGAGGATRGYQLAGFHVTGVDIEPQPNYCGDDFVQADALEFPLGGFDAVHASPVCYLWSKMRDCRPGSKVDQPDLITPLRPRLQASGLPYVIENVPGSPLVNPVQLCGSGFGLPLQRHRWFESNVPLWGVPCAHGQNPWNPDYGHSTGRRRRRVPVIGEWRVPAHLQHEAMGHRLDDPPRAHRGDTPGLHAPHRHPAPRSGGASSMTWPPEDLTWTPPSPWQNTWRCGPGEHQAVMDDLELGPRVAIVWASGQVGCVTPLSSPERLRGMGDGQLAMFGEPR